MSATDGKLCLITGRRGECHKGVGGRQFVTAEKSAAQIPTLTEIDAVCFVRIRMANARFRTRCCVYICKNAVQCLGGEAHVLWHTKVPWLQLQNEIAAKNMPRREILG